MFTSMMVRKFVSLKLILMKKFLLFCYCRDHHCPSVWLYSCLPTYRIKHCNSTDHNTGRMWITCCEGINTCLSGLFCLFPRAHWKSMGLEDVSKVTRYLCWPYDHTNPINLRQFWDFVPNLIREQWQMIFRHLYRRTMYLSLAIWENTIEETKRLHCHLIPTMCISRLIRWRLFRLGRLFDYK